MELPATRSLLVFLSMLTLWSIGVDGASPAAAAMAPAPVRFGVGSRSPACDSVEVLDAFYLKQPSCTNWAELRAKDSSAEDLIDNAQVPAIIWGPQTLDNADHIPQLADQSHIPALSFNGSYPILCALWQKDHVTAYLTLGSNDSMVSFYPRTKEINDMKLDTRNLRKNRKSQMVRTEFEDNVYPIFEKQNVTRNKHGYKIVKSFDYVFDVRWSKLTGNISSSPRKRCKYSRSDKQVDSGAGEVTITKKGPATDFTMTYTESGLSMIVLVENEPNTISWTFVKPLSRNLWFATIVFFFYTSIVVWMIEIPKNQEYQGSSLRQCTTALYFVFSTLTFSHGQSIRSPLSKIVVVIWCFVVLILVQSYTSSLSSMLTAKRLLPWVVDLDQLQYSGDFVGYQDDSFVRSFLVNRHNISESRLKNYATKEEYVASLRKGSKNGGVSAIVGAIPYLTSFISDTRYKNNFMMLGCIYEAPGFGFGFRLGFPLVRNLSSTILDPPEGVSNSQMELKCFGTTSTLMADDIVPNFGFAPLTLQSFSGLFVITGSISTLMILITIARLVYTKCSRSRNIDMESVGDNSVEEDSRSMQNGVDDNPNPNQQLLHEAGDDNFHGVREGGENDGGAHSEPVQQNDMHGSMAPAAHFEIETNNV
ncbi:glutamate receptor 2.8-like [Hordeum vulgare]|uniref:Predicted protein n=1 Tax=Hordeum vulgare subsp. vulgare TaxID=112509 RepID=F2D9C8_HORVV|nr:glutamate receptor 2.8-like [Hordeum vulgare]BAJ91699.1 predicted protein [Hordeum vulgare subsp. vulgare]